MAKVTILSDAPTLPTGFSNQSKLLADYLTRHGHDVHYLANGYTGATIKNVELEDGTKFNYKIYGQKQNQYFADQITPHLKETNSDAFFILLDTFMMFGQDGWFLRTDTSPAQTFFWFPSDGGGGLPVYCDKILRKVEYPVAMSKFGQKQVLDYYGIKAHYIPHGTEPKRFYRLPDLDRYMLRTRYGLQDKFVIGVVARNQQRKMLDRTMKAMYLIKSLIPNAVLFLHIDPTDVAQIWDIRHLIIRYGLENRVVFSGMNWRSGFTWAQMNEVYNVMDCFFLSTSGEGFGIPIIEAMSCEIPVVATDYTTTPELIKEHKCGFGIKLSGTEEVDMFEWNSIDYDNKVMNGTLTGSWEVERGLCDCEDAAKKIKKLYDDPELCKQMGRNGREAVLKYYDFENVVGPAWMNYIMEGIKK